jgi:uncharacterized paraquat-inducible protein A
MTNNRFECPKCDYVVPGSKVASVSIIRCPRCEGAFWLLRRDPGEGQRSAYPLVAVEKLSLGSCHSRGGGSGRSVA